MKKTIKILLIIASALPVTCSLFTLPCLSDTYTLIGERHLRKYSAQEPSQVYNSETDAQQIVNNLCYVDWVRSNEKNATATSHTESQLDMNVENRDKFDAALFCAYHKSGTHVVYANAAVYRYRMPDGQLPRLTSLSAYVSSDPYNALGARIVLMTNSTGDIPTDCATCRGDVEGGIKAAGVAPRITRTSNGKNYWYPASSNVVFNSSNGLSTGLQLQKYLFVFVLMENYATSRGNWIEGCSYIANSISITTSSSMPGWTDGSTVDLSSFAEEDDEIDVTESANIPWNGKMAAYDRKMTVVKLLDANGNASYFGAPENAFRLLHRNDTNLTAITHVIFRYGSSWGLGPRTNLTQASFAPSARPVKVRSVYADKSVTVMHGAVRMERGYEMNPPTRDLTDTDRGLIGSYASAFGVSAGSSESLAASTSIPVGWLLYCGATTYSDTDGDGLDIVHEWNNGNSPTDPFNPDTDGDTIVDGYALLYHLNGVDGHKDFDGDGLSNYSEYLISNVFRVASTSPEHYSTSGTVCDYFKRFGNMYLGEIFTDFDQVDDEWESLYPTSCNPYVYDPDRDDDGDGWSNYAEYRAGTDPTKVTEADGSAQYPIPTVRMRVVNGSDRILNGPLSVIAWNERTGKDMTGAPDARWSVTNAYGTCDFIFDVSESRSSTCGGYLREGKTTFYCWADENADGKYTAGEPFGVVRGVDVGWQGAKFTVELTETSPITTRLSLTGPENDRDVTIQRQLTALLGDRTITTINAAVLTATSATQRAEIAAQLRFAISNRVQTVYAQRNKVRVRVVRYGIDDKFAYSTGTYVGGVSFNERVVMEKEFDIRARDYIDEADFLDDSHFDIDWGTMTGEIVDVNGDPILGAYSADCHVTNMTYLVVIGDGAKDFRGSQDTNTIVYAAGAVTRRFEQENTRPQAENVNAICYAAHPTFRWSMSNESEWAKRFGSSYTAFKLKIFAEDGVTKIYDSGVRRAPTQDANGVFSWTAEASVGDLLATKKLFNKTGNYTWQVAMYNAKFVAHEEYYGGNSNKTEAQLWAHDKPSAIAKFSVAVNAQQEMNDHQYSSIDVAVKYAGPSEVLSNYTDLTTKNGKVRVQAFATADFAGAPLSETVVTNGVDAFASTTDNARLVGLDATGTYYIRAYIDSNGNHKRDAWESCGRAKDPVVLTTSLVKAPLVNVWIEDCDTDNDLFPDSWEYVSYGSLTNVTAGVKDASKTIFTANMLSNARTSLSSFSTGIQGTTMTLFENSTTNVTHLLGWGTNNGNITFDGIRNAVQSNIVERVNQ